MSDDQIFSTENKFEIFDFTLKFKYEKSREIGRDNIVRIPVAYSFLYNCLNKSCDIYEKVESKIKGIGTTTENLSCPQCGNQDSFVIPKR